jgi:zinc transporter
MGLMMNENNNNPILISELLAGQPIFSCQLDGKGNANFLNDKSDLSTAHPYWIHLDFAKSETISWINETKLIPDLIKNELIKPNQYPKEIRYDSSILVVLKGVNFTPNELPDPIVTFRFYITDNLIISTRHQKIDAIIKLKENLEKGIGPVDVADWLIQLAELIRDQVNLSFDGVHNKIIKLEDQLLNQRIFSHKEIGRIRKQLFILRRLLSPQRDIFVKISTERISWIDDNDRQRLHDISNQQNQQISEIDSCLLRIASVIEQINSILAESTNKRIYLMSLFTIIFTPITFITSLLGVNLAGIPFNEKEWSFVGLIVLLVVISIISVIWLKLKKWW